MAKKTKNRRNGGGRPTPSGTQSPEKRQNQEKAPPIREEPAAEEKASRFRPELIVLTLAALFTRLWRVYIPDAVVFDEVHFKGFAAHYLDGKYFFDIHPPLGKLLLAGYAHIIGFSSSAMLKTAAVQMRVLPAVFGALLVPLVWALLRQFGVGRPLAFLGAFMVLADNALLVESRFILLDPMLMFFGFAGLYLYLVARKSTGRGRWIWLSLSALAAGAAFSIKWTGLASFALVGLCWIWDNRRDVGKHRRRLLGELAVLILIPAILYVGAFWVHFALLPKTGEGDAFMSPTFQSMLIGSKTYDPKASESFAQKFIEINGEIMRSNAGLTATHPYSSAWYTWPLELRPIYYWVGANVGGKLAGYIYLLGNPVVWWGLLAALLAGLVFLRLWRRRISEQGRFALVVTGSAYLMNLLPFVAVTRVMFFYHYFFSFIFSLIFVIVLWDELIKGGSAGSQPARRGGVSSPKVPARAVAIAVAAIAIAVTVGFVFFAPISYGFPLSEGGLQARMWLTSWR